jgi:ABC-type dipeptide/oligopeptide/nickel transport system permease component
VVSLVFLLIHLVPGDPIQQMLGEGATPADCPAPPVRAGSAAAGSSTLHYWFGVLRGDLGSSIRLHDTVASLIAARYPYTLALTLTALGFGLLLALPAGFWPRCGAGAGWISCSPW